VGSRGLTPFLFDLWLGPAPARPFNSNRFHYNWHWNWDYGTGELGNNGIHALDVVRFLLGLDAPLRITSAGGKLFYDDDQVTPDTLVTTFDFTPVLSGSIAFGRGRVLKGSRSASFSTEKTAHWSDCIKDHRRPNADIEEGHKSTRLCHLGNIAFRTGHSLRFDEPTETLIDDPEANKLLGRTYREPYVCRELASS
jgi:hypothetical protein